MSLRLGAPPRVSPLVFAVVLLVLQLLLVVDCMKYSIQRPVTLDKLQRRAEQEMQQLMDEQGLLTQGALLAGDTELIQLGATTQYRSLTLVLRSPPTCRLLSASGEPAVVELVQSCLWLGERWTNQAESVGAWSLSEENCTVASGELVVTATPVLPTTFPLDGGAFHPALSVTADVVKLTAEAALADFSLSYQLNEQLQGPILAHLRQQLQQVSGQHLIPRDRIPRQLQFALSSATRIHNMQATTDTDNNAILFRLDYDE